MNPDCTPGVDITKRGFPTGPCDAINSKPAKPPAQRIIIHAVNNGWTVDVDFNARYDACGVSLPQYVYTSPHEVAAAVGGLITRGVPNDYRPVSDDLTNARLLIKALQSENDGLLASLERTKATLEKTKEESGAAFKSFSEEFAKHQKCQAALSTAFDEGRKLGQQQTMKVVSELCKKQIEHLRFAPNYVVQSQAQAPAPENALDIRVGDVWVGTNSVGTFSRAITAIEDGRVSYCYPCKAPGRFLFKRRTIADMSRILKHDEAYVTRQAVHPAIYENEPSAGFIVGDVWKCGSQMRFITAVTPTHIIYDYRNGDDDKTPYIVVIPRSDRKSVLLKDGAILIRK